MSPAKPRFLPHLPADFLAEHQLAGVRWSVQQAMKSPQYRAKLAAAGIACGEDIKTLDDVRRLPFSDVADLRDGYPLPLLCVEPSEVVRVHASSGTTGKRKILAYTQKDVDTVVKFANIMCNASLCGLGEAAQSALLSAMEHFPEVFEIKKEVAIR